MDFEPLAVLSGDGWEWRIANRQSAIINRQSLEVSIVFVQLKKEFLGKPVGERIHLADADAELLVQKGVAEEVADDPLAPLLARTMERAVETALDQFAKSQSKSRKNATPELFGPDG